MLDAQGHPFYLIKTSDGGTWLLAIYLMVFQIMGPKVQLYHGHQTEAGTYYYICEYHPSMLGTITVTE